MSHVISAPALNSSLLSSRLLQNFNSFWQRWRCMWVVCAPCLCFMHFYVMRGFFPLRLISILCFFSSLFFLYLSRSICVNCVFMDCFQRLISLFTSLFLCCLLHACSIQFSGRQSSIDISFVWTDDVNANGSESFMSLLDIWLRPRSLLAFYNYQRPELFVFRYFHLYLISTQRNC